jgi:hypothetical protein
LEEIMRAATPARAIPVLVLVMVMACLRGTARGQELSLCGSESRTAPAERSKLLILLYPRQPSGVGGHLQVSLELSATAKTHGVVHITDGTSNTIMFGEVMVGAVECGDINGNGVAGVMSLLFAVRDVHTRQTTFVRLVAEDGEIDENGAENLILVIGDSIRVAQSSVYVLTRDPRPSGL